MKTPKNIILLCLTSLSFSLPISVAAQNNQSLNLTKAWFKPAITQNKDAVCASLLTQVQQDFFSATGTRTPLTDTPAGPIQNDQYWTLQNIPEKGFLLINNENIYAREFLGRGCGGACESSYIALHKGPFSEADNYGDAFSFTESQITDSVPAYGSDSGLYKHQNGSYYAITNGETFNVYKALPNATWNKVCEITTVPSEATYKQVADIYSSIKKLNHTVDAITGEEGNMCGSMHTLSRWRQSIQQNLEKTLYKPWVLHESTDNDSTYVIDITNLESWSLKDISQKLVFEEYKKQLAITTKDLSLFYQKSYQWPAATADNMAASTLKTAISSGIRFYMYDQPSSSQKALINAITSKQPISTIKSLADVPDALTNINLNIAINYPQALELLLVKISNPNQLNEFKKSLLMYAAQYNQLESAKILLGKGANSNLFTIIPDDTCNFTLKKSGMTALHYAVRYAAVDLVKLLLNSGANPYSSTSEEPGGRPIDWLHKYTAEDAAEKNINLTKANIAELETLLRMPAKEEITQKVLNFNLAAEQAFQKGNLDEAYNKSELALGLDANNERTLSNLSLILIKQGKQEEALEASNKLITKGKDINQIANAWFNYGLICEKAASGYISYNGNSYCRDGALYPFIQSLKTKPTSARADKIVKMTQTVKGYACELSPEKDGLMALIQYCGSTDFCVLHSKDRAINMDTFSLLKQSHENPNDLKSPIKISAAKPLRIVESIPVGNYQLTRLARNYGEKTVKFGDQICTESSELLPSSKYP